MVRQQNPNIEILTMAVDRLGPVADELVFLGGCATGLLITDPAAPLVRVTTDVDVITEVASLRDYYQLADKAASERFCRGPEPRGSDLSMEAGKYNPGCHADKTISLGLWKTVVRTGGGGS